MFHKFFWSIRFAFAELRGEWLFALGVALAVSSVLTPAAILWGTKTTMIDTMRDRLLRDPTIRELVGQENHALPVTWFDEMRADPRVTFVIPSVRRISLYGNVSKPGVDARSVSDVAYLPTAMGDPVGGGVELNSDYKGGPVPCMIAARVSESLNASEGDTIEISVTRIETSETAQVTLNATISKILSISDSNAMAVFLPLPVIERIEDYKDGRAVELFSWNKNLQKSMRIYDGVRIRVESEGSPQDAVATALVKGNPNLSIRPTVDSGEFEVISKGDGITHAEVIALGQRIGSFQPRILLLAEASFEVVAKPGGERISSGSLAADKTAWITLEQLEQIEDDDRISSAPEPQYFWKLNSGEAIPSFLRLSLPVSEADGLQVTVPPQIVGIVGAAKRSPIEYNMANGELRPIRKEYPGFRLYASDLEDVQALRQKCADQGIAVRTNEDRIQNVLYLDAALGKFLAFVVVAGGLGGLGALFTSLYLSIERSRRQFAVFQIMGIPILYVFLSTFVQAVLMVLGGITASFVFFQIGAFLLTEVLSKEVDTPGKLCELGLWQWSLLASLSFGSALLATLLAIGRLRFKDPAVIARAE